MHNKKFAKLKKVMVGLMVCCMIGASTTISKTITTYAAGKNVPQKPNISDEDFLGRWNVESNTWTVNPCINYSYGDNDKLKAVEDKVKIGRYEEAKEALLDYYRSINRKFPESSREIADDAKNEMFMEDIFTGIGYVAKATIPAGLQDHIVEIDMLNKVSSAASGSGKFSIYLMGRDKGDEAVFSSREGGNAPKLVITIGGVEKIVETNSDTYVRAGDKYSKQIFGKEDKLYVMDSGIPFDENSKKTYMEFDIKDAVASKDEITSAKLILYGHTTDGEEMRILVLNSEQVKVDETKKNWMNSNFRVLSFKGADHSYRNLPFFDGRPGVDKNYSSTQSRFWYYMSLIHKYKETGDEAYAKRFLEIMSLYYNTFGGGDLLLPIEDRGAGDSLNAGLRVDQTLSAYGSLLNSESMTPDKHMEFLKFLYDDAAYLSENNTFWTTHARNNNWGMNQTMGMVQVNYYMPEFKNTQMQLSEAAKRMEYMLGNLILDDYSYIEGTNGYPTGILTDLIEYKEKMDNLQYTIPESIDDKIHYFARYFMNCIDPNGWMAEYGDDHYTYSSVLLEQLLKVGICYNDKELIYVGSKGAEGTRPIHTSVTYPTGKFMVARSGWEKNDTFLFTNWRPYATHSHNDALNLTVNAYGRRLLVDTSDRSYNDEPISNWQRKSRQSHNVVEIDNTTAYQGWTSGVDNLSSSGSTMSSDGFDIINGTYTEKRETGDFSQNRNILFLKPLNFFVVSDYMTVPEGKHTYSQYWHMAPDAGIALTDKNSVESNYAEGGNIKIVQADANQLTATVKDGYYDNVTHKYVSYEQSVEGANAVYDTVIYPYETGNNVEVSAQRIELDVAETTASAVDITLTKPDHAVENGTYYISHEEAPKNRTFGEYVTDGKVAYVHKNADDTITFALLSNGKELNYQGKSLIKSSSVVDSMSLEYGDDTLAIDTHKGVLIENLTVYVPKTIKNVVFNGSKISFTKVGENEIKVLTGNETEEDQAKDSATIETTVETSVETGDPSSISIYVLLFSLSCMFMLSTFVVYHKKVNRK